ncbi:FtsX-like permease family protein [Chitinophaga sp. G-6-1-13]|uniref:FtsX-like permease family protein n=1 Tax=Chitinophaga fulva TaxID=2728842 RepID=A0A848GGG3_9BACT|nr:ABC transporter permease [Chitinophaga fulva]NML36927.1 FtsX-like permease family protein [Chitinophaga fulva]
MTHNYIKVAYRNIIRNRVFSVINILGLALGIASSLLLLLWIQDEWRTGRYYDNLGSLFRIMENEIADGRTVTDEDTPGILAEELKMQIPEIAFAAGLSQHENHILTVGEKVSRLSGCFAGADWFNMYSIPLLAGSPASALNEPNNIAVSRKVAETFFKDAQTALGSIIRMDNGTDCKVTAVFEDLPANSLDKYDYLRNWNVFLKREPWLNVWENAGPGTRIRLKPNVDPQVVNAKLKTFLKGRNKDINASFNIELFLQPEADAWLYSNFTNGRRDGGRIEYVRLFLIVAVFILVIAAINFMNLATARSVKRAKEVGIRKVVGARRLSLIWQFMYEALLMTCMAAMVAVAAVWLSLPLFNLLTGKHLVLPVSEPLFWMALLLLLVVTALLSGSYPAFFLSSVQPVRVLKGVLKTGPEAHLIRRGLVVFQFVLSMLMIVGTIVVYQQLQYVQTKNLGFDRENLIVIPAEGAIPEKYQAFKQELLERGSISAVTHMQTNPLSNGNTTDGVQWAGKNPDIAIQFNNTSVGYDFVKTMKLQLARGRDFSSAFGSDSVNYLINESAAKRMGYEDPVGQPLTFGKRPGVIVGVLHDFHFNSLHVPIRPLIVRLNERWAYGFILIKAQAGQTKQALATAEALCRKMNPRYPFTYSFLDEDFQKVYNSEAVVGKLIGLFTCLSICIACLGLFGLAAFTAEQRTKEIGVRKVLGASVTNIVALLSGDFLKLILLAIVIASPIAWYAMSQWLETFSYRISISWIVLALSGLIAVLIAGLTISIQSIRAALVNPVNSLRGE